ncbi:MAG TPA: transglutaminase domain-containing protein [candidate division Zixibacteria bacterium]|nr:transglutaminase domain-containing protein [candidate division Zixibacteria bacterium]
MTRDRSKIWRKLKPFVVAIVLIWWGAMIVLLVKRTSVPNHIELGDVNIVDMGELISEDYYSVTFRGKKIGYSSITRREIPDGQLIQETSFYRLNIGGISQEITTGGIITVDDSLRAKTMTYDFSGGGYRTTVNAVIRNGELRVEIITPTARRGMIVPLEEPIYTPTVLPELLKERGFERGSFDLPSFNPLTSMARSYRVDVVGQDRIRRFGDRDVWEVRLVYGPLITTMFIDTTGTLLMEQTPEGFMSVRENREKAMRIDLRDDVELDFMTEFQIPLGVAVIERPREAVRLVLRVRNLQAGLFDLDDFNQTWDDEDSILTVDSRGIPEATLPEVLPSDTAQTADIQSRDRRMVSAAERITRGAGTDFERLQAINDYLYKNIDKSLTASIPSALDVLQRMRGDCNEHSVLFVALARALGIPARMNVGLIYMDGYFYYHAWVQAFADGEWHTFDATLGQNPVDATHVKLTAGDLDQMLALLRFGEARLSFVEVEYEGDNVER